MAFSAEALCVCVQVFWRFDLGEHYDISRDRNYFIWTPRESQSEVIVYFGGFYAARLYCILKDHWKNFRDRFGPSKHFQKALYVNIRYMQSLILKRFHNILMFRRYFAVSTTPHLIVKNDKIRVSLEIAKSWRKSCFQNFCLEWNLGNPTIFDEFLSMKFLWDSWNFLGQIYIPIVPT